VTREQELEFLKSEAQALRDDLKKLETEIGKLSAEKE
jgi:predicted  nucleic acid-binding Zn-ribbon protein